MPCFNAFPEVQRVFIITLVLLHLDIVTTMTGSLTESSTGPIAESVDYLARVQRNFEMVVQPFGLFTGFIWIGSRPFTKHSLGMCLACRIQSRQQFVLCYMELCYELSIHS